MSRLEQKKAQLAKAKSRLQAIYDEGLFAGRLDLDGTAVDVNRSWLDQCVSLRADVMGKPAWECGWWNRSPDAHAWVRRAVTQCARGESRAEAHSGTIFSGFTIFSHLAMSAVISSPN